MVTKHDQAVALSYLANQSIGDSRHGKTVANSPVKKQEWGELDMTAAFAWTLENIRTCRRTF